MSLLNGTYGNTQSSQSSQSSSKKGSVIWEFCKSHVGLLVICAVIIYFLFWMMSPSAKALFGSGGMLSNLLSLAKTFGILWIVLGILGLLIPFLGKVLDKFFNNGVDKAVQIDNFKAIKDAPEMEGTDIEGLVAEAVREYLDGVTGKLTPEEVSDAATAFANGEAPPPYEPGVKVK